MVECTPNGRTDECFTGPEGAAGVGICYAGSRECVDGDWGECLGERLPAPTDDCEDGLDNDCDGVVDDGCSCTTFDLKDCYGGTAESRDVGECRSGQQQCVGSAWSIECAGQVLPHAVDACGDGLDDDCNGLTDDGCGGADGGTG
jgi:hypothetical protein